MDFLDNVVKSSNALLKEKLPNPFASKQQPQDGDQKQQQSSDSNQAPADTQEHPSSNQQQQTEAGEQVASPAENGQSKGSQFAAIAADAEVVTQKAVKGAKDFGSFLFSMGNKAAQTVSQTAKQVKQAVENTSILTDFTREQQDFIKEHGGSMQAGELPWASSNETKAAEIKEQVLSLSQDKRNFVRAPPNEANFQFEAQQCYPIALSLLKEDPNLGKMRFELVPKLVNEDTFWRNYFYRVHLLKQMSDRGEDIKRQGWASSRSSSGEGPDELISNTIDQDNNQEPTSPSYETQLQTETTATEQPTSQKNPFAIDQLQYDYSSASNYDYSAQNAEALEDTNSNLFADDDDLKSKLRELNIGSLDEGGGQDDENEKWEEELQRDLQEFELINGSDVSALDEQVLDNELMELKKDDKSSNNDQM